MELIAYLLSNGADVHLKDLDGDTPLLVCEEPEVFQALVAAGADPAATNTAGEGILQKVFEDENEKMVLFLMENHYVNDPDFKFEPGQFDLQFEEQTYEEGTGGMEAVNEDDDDGDEDEDDVDAEKA